MPIGAEGVGVLRPTFLRADVQGRWGASKTIKYTGVAERLTVGGYPTKVDELKNARRTAPVAGVVPPTGALATASDPMMKASAGNRVPWRVVLPVLVGGVPRSRQWYGPP